MRTERLKGIWTLRLETTDENAGEIAYAAGEVLKIDVAANGATGLSMTIAPTASGDPVDEYAPAARVGQMDEFRISDASLAPHVAEGETIYFNIWAGTADDPIRLAYGMIKRKPSIQRAPAIIDPDAPWLMEAGFWNDSGSWNDYATWTEAA